MSHNIYSTGVLRRGKNTTTAVAEVLNLSSKKTIVCTVEMFNWSNYDIAIPIAVKIGEDFAKFPYKLGSNQLAEFYADLLGKNDAVLYEIRTIISDDDMVVVNCFGNSAFPYTSQEGNTVLFRELVKIDK